MARPGSFLQPYVSSPGIANFCGFLMVFCGVLILGAIVGRLLARMMKVAGLSFVDRLLGAGFGVVRGILISIALVLALLAFTPGKSPPNAVVRFARGAVRDRRGAGVRRRGAARIEGRIPEELRAGEDDLGQRPEKGHSGIAGCGKGMR